MSQIIIQKYNHIMYNRNNILLTSISSKISCMKCAREALSKIDKGGEIFGSDTDITPLCKYFLDKFWNCKPISEMTCIDIIEFCEKNHIFAIIPTRDGDLEFFSLNRDVFLSKGIAVMVSPLSTIKICNDKLLFFQKLNDLGFPVIETFQSVNNETYSKWVVKEQFGTGSKSILLNVDSNAVKECAEGFQSPIYQPYIEGIEYSIDVYVRLDGNVHGGVARRRDLVKMGEAQVTTAVDLPELVMLCAQMSQVIGIYGHAVWQVLCDENGRFWIIECNARIGGASSLSVAMGLDSYYWFFLESLRKDINAFPFNRSQVNLRQIRVPHDIVRPYPDL